MAKMSPSDLSPDECFQPPSPGHAVEHGQAMASRTRCGDVATGVPRNDKDANPSTQ